MDTWTQQKQNRHVQVYEGDTETSFIQQVRNQNVLSMLLMTNNKIITTSCSALVEERLQMFLGSLLIIPFYSLYFLFLFGKIVKEKTQQKFVSCESSYFTVNSVHLMEGGAC